MRNHFKQLLLAFSLIALLGLCTGCGDGGDYRRTLESGQQKYLTGQPMTKQEYNAVKNFNNWKSNQGTKTYNQWGD